MSTTELAITGVPGVELTPAGLRVTEALSPGNYRHVGRALAKIQGMSAWAVGDWANSNPDKNQGVTQEIADLVGLNVATVQTYARIAMRFPIGERRNNVNWGVHQSVAPLPPERANPLLDQAEKEGWTIEKMREKVRGTKPKPRGAVTVLNGSPTITLDVAWIDSIADDPDLLKTLNVELRRMVEEWEFVKTVAVREPVKL